MVSGRLIGSGFGRGIRAYRQDITCKVYEFIRLVISIFGWEEGEIPGTCIYLYWHNTKKTAEIDCRSTIGILSVPDTAWYVYINRVGIH